MTGIRNGLFLTLISFAFSSALFAWPTPTPTPTASVSPAIEGINAMIGAISPAISPTPQANAEMTIAPVTSQAQISMSPTPMPTSAPAPGIVSLPGFKQVVPSITFVNMPMTTPTTLAGLTSCSGVTYYYDPATHRSFYWNPADKTWGPTLVPIQGTMNLPPCQVTWQNGAYYYYNPFTSNCWVYANGAWVLYSQP